MTNNSQKSFLEFLHNKFNMAIVGYAKETLQVQLNKIKDHKIFLVTYTYKNTMNYIHKDKDGKVFISKVNNYTIKNEQTGEYKHVYISQSKILFTTLHQRDLVILDNKNEYDKKLATSLSEYGIVEPKRLPIFFRIDQATFLSDLMKVGYYEV